MRQQTTLENLLTMIHAYCKDYVGYLGRKKIPLQAIAQHFGKRAKPFEPKRLIELLAEDPQLRFAVNMEEGRASYYVTLVSPEAREQILESRRLLAASESQSEPQPEPSDS